MGELTPWAPGVLGAGVFYAMPQGGVHVQMLTLSITRAKKHGLHQEVFGMQVLEATIICTDNIIEQLMGEGQ